jgi:cyanophycin synthetase
VARPFSRGVTLAVGAPVDALYTAVALNEAAAEAALAEVEGQGPVLVTDVLGDLRQQRDNERDPVLVALAEAAFAHRVELLWGEEAVTVGAGARGVTFPADALPEPADLDWKARGAAPSLPHSSAPSLPAAVPLALVTGTNGKSTTARLLAAMARAAGHAPGLSTTDYVAVGGEIIERGDFSGPMGARAALRDQRVTLGVLEIARGGLLRRGVPVRFAEAAAVTNVAADHLGEYGVETVEALAEAKFVVSKGLRPGGILVLSAECPVSTAEHDRQRETLAARGLRVAWTALDLNHPRLPPAPLAAAVVEGTLALRREGSWRALLPVAEVPFALGGVAVHNVRNALAALTLGAALGLPDEALARALRTFSDADNPGRANRFRVRGADVLVDYAHNPHGVAALVALAEGFPAARRLMLLSSAGDRSDGALVALAEAAAALRADRYLLADLPDHLRGRRPGEVPEVLARALVAQGIPAEACTPYPDPVEATREALAWARPGDSLLLFVLSHREAVVQLLREASA